MTVAPCGTWRSPITAEMLASSGVWLEEVWIEDGVTYWSEGRPAENGRYVIVRGDPWSTPKDVIPQGFNARTKVHEYGGGAYAVHRGRVFFSNFEDQRLYRVDGGAVDGGAEPVAITAETGGRHRFADGRVTPDGGALICVRERHEGESPEEVVNELVAVPTDGAADPRVLTSGSDFYAFPRMNTDGTKLAWLCWDLPNMPWDGTELWVADLAPGGDLSNERLVAGGPEESVFQPAWSPEGVLHFVSDRTGWWNLYRATGAGDGSEADALCPMEAEFGWPLWVFGAATYAFLSDGRIACAYGRRGVQHLALLDPASGELLDLDLPHTAIDYPYLAAEGSTVVFVAAGPAIPPQVVSLDFATRGVEVLRESERVEVDAGYLSVPRQIEFPTEGGLTAFAHFYPPANPAFAPLEGERPPLVVMSHGGPTSESSAEFDLHKQFWTSRGFAVVDVNYGGSTGYGREFRRRLNGTWGVTDTADCINAARFLANEGLVDGARLAIRGGSAGGYTTLCALTFHDDFAVGASYYGLADLESFATGGTHKFESRYLDSLVGPWPAVAETLRARSPIRHTELLNRPMILFHGLEDEIVPPAQAEMMVEALEAKSIPYAYLAFEGEQHGFRRAETIRRSLEAELSFYARIFGFEPADDIEPLEIRGLS